MCCLFNQASMGPLLVQIPTAKFFTPWFGVWCLSTTKSPFPVVKNCYSAAQMPAATATCKVLHGFVFLSPTVAAHLIHHRATIYFTQIARDAYADMKRKIKARVQKTGRTHSHFRRYIAVLKQSVESTSIIYKKTKGGKTAPPRHRRRRRQWKGKCSERPVFSFAFLSFSALYLLEIIFFMCYTCCSVFDFLTAREKLHLNFKIFPRRWLAAPPCIHNFQFIILHGNDIKAARCTVWKFMRPARVLRNPSQKCLGPADGWARRCVPTRKSKSNKRAWCYARALYFSQKVTHRSLQGIRPLCQRHLKSNKPSLA